MKRRTDTGVLIGDKEKRTKESSELQEVCERCAGDSYAEVKDTCHPKIWPTWHTDSLKVETFQKL